MAMSALNSERSAPLLSVIMPCLDEEAVIRETHRRLVAEVKDGNPGGAAPRRNTTHPD